MKDPGPRPNTPLFSGLGTYWVVRAQAVDIDDSLEGARMCVRHAINRLKVILRTGPYYHISE